ncbi:MAG: hypothetical protein HFH68_09295 [Lachnospiraceae bacterium]|nr:hypothetical protein [Lachnospiraceae bacterium]
MKLVITDTGFIWNKDNPFLKKYKDSVLVVCLYGKAVTEQYECFVSPFAKKNDMIMGMDQYGIEDRKFQRLASVGEKLNAKLGCHDDIVFLTDAEPSTLYPFYVIKELNKHNSLHLVAVPPWKFESSSRKKGYREMLSALSQIHSVLYYDSEKVPKILGYGTTFTEAYTYITNDLGEMMPYFLNGIQDMRSGFHVFDFSRMKYILSENSFYKTDQIAISQKDQTDGNAKSPSAGKSGMLGFMSVIRRPSDTKEDTQAKEEGRLQIPSYLLRTKDSAQWKEQVKILSGKVRLKDTCTNSTQPKEEIERMPAIPDGKNICNMLREQRIRLAKANHIPFQSEDCPSTGSCPGTCGKCDAESEYLREQLQKIPEEKRIYPQFDPEGGMQE